MQQRRRVPAAARFRAQARPDAGLFTRWMNYPVAARWCVFAYRMRLRPTTFTLANLLLGSAGSVLVIAAAPMIAEGQAPGVAAAVLAWLMWQAAYCCDCADGQLARVTGTSTAAGAHLDVLCDIGVQIMLITATAVAAAGQPGMPVWLPAAFAGAVAVVPLGPWVEFHRKRPIMVGVDLLRGVTLLSVPVAAWAGELTFGQLCVVAAAQTVGTIVSSAASTAFLKSLVPADRLVLINARWESTMWTAGTLGPPAGGMLVSWLGALAALLVDAASFLLSAVTLGRIRHREPAPAAPEGGRHSMAGIRARSLLMIFFPNFLRNGLILGQNFFSAAKPPRPAIAPQNISAMMSPHFGFPWSTQTCWTYSLPPPTTAPTSNRRRGRILHRRRRVRTRPHC